MGDRSIRKEAKKPKKSAVAKSSAGIAPISQSVAQPTVIKKDKKIK